MNRIELFNDHFQNYKVYGLPKAQLIIADIPYNVGKNAYGFEIKKNFFNDAKKMIEKPCQISIFKQSKNEKTTMKQMELTEN